MSYHVLPVTTGTKDTPWWVYPDMDNDFQTERAKDWNGAKVWREVREEMFWQALEVLPPISLMGYSVFMVSEAHSTDRDGNEVYAMFANVHGRYFARHSTLKTWQEDLEGLRQSIPLISLAR